ncbi:MAG: hypothetical protein R3C17_22215 [Planctomycetaceae bacterium]
MSMKRWLSSIAQSFGSIRSVLRAPMARRRFSPGSFGVTRAYQQTEAFEDRTLLSNVTIGQTVYETIGKSGDVDEFTFTLNAPTRLYLDALTTNGNVIYSLQGPAGLAVSGQYLQYSSPVLDLIGGEYKLEFQSIDDSTGGYSFRLLDLTNSTTLVPGVPVTGALGPAGETDVFTFPVAAGDEFSFITSTVDPMNATWRLLDPLGQPVFDNYLGTDELNRSLSMTGSYTLLVEGSVFDSGSVNYNFDVTFLGNTPPAPFTGVAYTVGATRSSTISAPNEIDRLIFTLGSATDLYLDSLSSAGGITWTLEGPGGIVLSSHFLEYGDVVLPNMIAGNYQIRLEGPGGTTGSYSFRVLNLASATALTPGTAVSGLLAIGGRETDPYNFTANAGDKFYFDSLTTVPGSAGWRLIDPLGRDVFNTGLGSDVDTLTLPLTGTYTLLIEGYFFDATNVNYSFNVRPVTDAAPVAITTGATVTGSISSPGESDRYTFTLGSAGRLYFDALSGVSGIHWTLAGAIGVEVSSRPLEYDYVYAGLDPALNLPAGTYQLTIDGDGSLTGAYSFRMLDLDSTTSLTPGTLVNGTLMHFGTETAAYHFTAATGDEFFFDTQTLIPQNAYWRLVDPMGQTVFSASLGSDVDTRTMPLTGNYTLLVEGYYFDTSNVDYSFSVRPVFPTAPSTLALDSTATASISTPGEIDQYTFTLAADSRLYFDALSGSVGMNWTLEGSSWH